MDLKESRGVCRPCKDIIGSRQINRHLQKCETYKNTQGIQDVFLIKAEAGPFWVFFEIGISKQLRDLDNFLRKLWVECCGHLSMFTINNQKYVSYDDELDYGDKTMKVKLGNALVPGKEFFYEYDFGTTTDLELTCLVAKTGGSGITIVARNMLPEFKCGFCESDAKEICAQCIWEGKGFFCKKCIKQHKCGDEYALPFVNSPRTGMCGFTGYECKLLNK